MAMTRQEAFELAVSTFIEKAAYAIKQIAGGEVHVEVTFLVPQVEPDGNTRVQFPTIKPNRFWTPPKSKEG